MKPGPMYENLSMEPIHISDQIEPYQNIDMPNAQYERLGTLDKIPVAEPYERLPADGTNHSNPRASVYESLDDVSKPPSKPAVSSRDYQNIRVDSSNDLDNTDA